MGAGRQSLTPGIARAYAVFARPAPDRLFVCTDCCMDPAVERAILAKAPRDLTLAEVRAWLDAAFDGSGGRAAVDWILPRILDLLRQGAGLEREVALARLVQTGFPQDWPGGSREVVAAACLEAFDAFCAGQGPGLDAWLCMVARGGLEIGPFLDRLEALPDAVLARVVHADWARPRGLSIRMTPFWDGAPGARDAVAGWYAGTALLLAMDRAMRGGSREAAAVHDFLVQGGAGPQRR